MPSPALAQTQQEKHAIEQMQLISDARHHDPFSFLGLHFDENKNAIIRVYLPKATNVSVVIGEKTLELKPHAFHGFYTLEVVNLETVNTLDKAKKKLPEIQSPLELIWQDDFGNEHTTFDTYSFPPFISPFDLHLFGEGRHWEIYNILGAHECQYHGVYGVRFATWAPNAERVSVIGHFNNWDGRIHSMRSRGSSGVWEIFIPGLKTNDMYKFEIRNRSTGHISVKIDPYGRTFEKRPASSSIVTHNAAYAWSDEQWIKHRQHWNWQTSPVSVYEVHLSSWKRDELGNFLNYREIAHQLAEYVNHLNFTHIELLPITEHPLDDSWGYQTTGYYAPSSRFGNADDFKYFVNHLHAHNIGIILDWVPAHFPKDEHALARFDGTALYEHEDSRIGEHKDWGTLIYNFKRNEVRNFLLANALYWLKEFHIDGLRVDAVAAMLHLDYSRNDGEWIPNEFGGNENLEAVDFIRELNIECHGQHPGVLMIAEESTSWPQVSGPTWIGGLGFSMKWNMGWMHDTLEYMSKDPIHRQFHHNQLTFGLMYAFSENFQLPFSHDEVVYGKQSLLHKMPGDQWQQFANLRLLYTYMITYPGSKLIFMGGEFAQRNEWNHNTQLDWNLLDYEPHRGVFNCLKDLNHLYRDYPALYQNNFSEEGFQWIDCNDNTQSILSYIRRGNNESDDNFVVAVMNFTPEPRDNYCITVPSLGKYQMIFNSDSHFYGGSNSGNNHVIDAFICSERKNAITLSLNLPPLAGIILLYEK